MANFYYYIKKGGTAVGDAGRFSTKQTGSFATLGPANYYDNIVVAHLATNPPGINDDVLLSHLHVHDYAILTFLQLRDGVSYISVNDSFLDVYLKGATEKAVGASLYDFHLIGTILNKVVFVKGMTFVASNEIYSFSAGSQMARFVDCDFYLNSNLAGNRIEISNTQDGSIGFFKKCSFNFNHPTQKLRIVGGNYASFDQCSVTGSTSGFIEVGGYAGGLIRITNSDLTGLGETPTIVHGGATTTDDLIRLEMYRCRVPAGTKYLESTVLNKSNYVNIQSIAIGSNSDNYYYFYEGNPFFGAQESDTTIFRTDGPQYDKSGNRLSSKITTTPEASRNNPGKFFLGSKFIDTDIFNDSLTIKAHIARDGSAVPFKKDEIWMEVVYHDGDQSAFGRVIDTEPEVLTTATDLDSESGLWSNLSGSNNEMSISSGEITIGTGSGNISSGVVEVYLYVAREDVLFACRGLEVS
ncbi:MAG: hypothetical protein COA79_20985 [Planctomycetota bacterium]|nr:MAG: hypothetical protein COA79_20985 [Planctomycetota bacterium]